MEEEVQVIRNVNLTHSPTIGAIAAALAKAHAQFEAVTKDAANPFFKSRYADLATVISATGDGLSANGLALIQSPGNVTGKSLCLTSMLVHSSGEWFRSELEMPLKEATAQGVGSAVTYARRYAAQAFLNVAGEDDDGNAATGRMEPKETAKQFDERTEEQRRITPTQVKGIWDAIKRTGKTDYQVEAHLATLGLKQVEEVMRGQFQDVIKWAHKPVPVPQDLTEALKTSVDKANGQKRFAALFAAAKAKGIPEEDVKRCAYESYKVSSMTELTQSQLEGVFEWVKGIE